MSHSIIEMQVKCKQSTWNILNTDIFHEKACCEMLFFTYLSVNFYLTTFTLVTVLQMNKCYSFNHIGKLHTHNHYIANIVLITSIHNHHTLLVMSQAYIDKANRTALALS